MTDSTMLLRNLWYADSLHLLLLVCACLHVWVHVCAPVSAGQRSISRVFPQVLSTFFFKLHFYFFCVYICVFIHGEQRTTCYSKFPSTKWALKIKLRLPGLAAGVFCWAISPAPPTFLFRQDLSLVRLTEYVRLAGHQAPGICLYPCPQYSEHTKMPSILCGFGELHLDS